jgi:carbonic anhydrase
VQAALRIAAAGSSERGKLAELLDAILPALSTVDRSSPPAQQMRRAVEANVRWAMRSLAATPAGREAIAGGRTRLVGAVYELATGHVRFLPDAPAP